MNSVSLVGRNVKKPEVRYNNETGMAVARFTLAVNRLKTRNNQDPGADFISCVAFGKTAENLEKYIDKGRLLAVTGRLQTGSYEGNNGKVYYTEVVADRVEFLDRANESEPTPQRETENKGNVKPSSEDQVYMGFASIDKDDIPFGG